MLRPTYTVFDIFAVKWLFRYPKTDPISLLVSHLVTPKDIVTKRGDSVRITDPSCKPCLTMQTFTLIGGNSAEIYVPKHKDKACKELQQI